MEPNNYTTINKNNERQTRSLMERWLKRFKRCNKNDFSFLDMNMTWGDQGFLLFGVYYKEGQAI
eukprot:9097355-Ditylum_brightwellii.AAC.1